MPNEESFDADVQEALGAAERGSIPESSHDADIIWSAVVADEQIDTLEGRELLAGDIVQVLFPDGTIGEGEARISTSTVPIVGEDGRITKVRRTKAYVRYPFHGTHADIYLRRKALKVRRIADWSVEVAEDGEDQ